MSSPLGLDGLLNSSHQTQSQRQMKQGQSGATYRGQERGRRDGVVIVKMPCRCHLSIYLCVLRSLEE